MHVAEREIAGCRIYAAALARTDGGYNAGVVVRARMDQHELWGTAALEDGRVWASAREALAHALAVGERLTLGWLGASSKHQRRQIPS